jgi:hypothetical protein
LTNGTAWNQKASAQQKKWSPDWKGSPQSRRKSLLATLVHLTSGLVTRIYRELKKLNFQRINDPKKKWAIELNRDFQKKKSKWQKTHEEMLNIPGHKEVQIKITLRLYLTPFWRAMIKNTNNNKCWWGCGEKGTPIYYWWECISTTTMGNSLKTPQKN